MKPNQLTAFLLLIVILGLIISVVSFVNTYSHLGTTVLTVVVYSVIILILRACED